MPKYRHLLLFVLVVTGLLIGLYIFKNTQIKDSAVDLDRTVVERVQFGYDCAEGKNVFELLDEQAEIEFTESSLGNLVSSINNEKQGNGKYWLYSIDGQEATVGASSYVCQGNEKILWELK